MIFVLIKMLIMMPIKLSLISVQCFHWCTWNWLPNTIQNPQMMMILHDDGGGDGGFVHVPLYSMVLDGS